MILSNAKALIGSQVTVDGHWSENIESSSETATISAAIDEIRANPERNKEQNRDQISFTQ